MNGREKFKKTKIIIHLFVNIIKCLPKKYRIQLFKFSRDICGYKGILIRYIIIKSISPKCGDNVAIFENVYLFNIDKIHFGSNISIHPLSYIDATGGLSIGDNVSIAHNVTIMTSSHSYTLDMPIKYQPIICKPVIIYENVWIGAKSTILYGIEIYPNSIIGANSLVNKNIPSNVVAAGIPIKILKYIK